MCNVLILQYRYSVNINVPSKKDKKGTDKNPILNVFPLRPSSTSESLGISDTRDPRLFAVNSIKYRNPVWTISMYQIYFNIPRSRFVLPFSFTFSHWKSTLPWPRRASLSLHRKERVRKRERGKRKKRQSGEEKYSFFSVISIRVSVSTSRRSCTEDLVVRATRERSSGSLHRSLHRGARSFARLTRQCRITSRIIPRVGT